MRAVLSTLNEIDRDPFTWDMHRADPLAALIAGGLDSKQAADTLADLKRESTRAPGDSWQSCDACFDPGADQDPFPR